MKTKIIAIFILMAFLLCSASCNLSSNLTDEEKKNQGIINDGKELVNEEPPDSNVYAFKDYDDLYKSLIKSDIKDKSYGTVYQSTLKAFSNKEVKLYVPSHDDKIVGLREKEGFDSVTVHTSELYNLPWIWYYCSIGNENLRIQISYPSVLNNKTVNAANDYLDVLSVIAPNAPTPDNAEKYDSYKSIVEKKLTLSNGKEINAIVKEVKDNDKKYVSFLQDGVLVVLYADSTLLTDEFISSFEMIEYTN